MPLIVLTSDRPPELRGIGAGQTIDQIGLYGTAVRWFCEVGTHDADDAGLLHMRATACRAVASAAGDPRPGPVHLNLSWRDPLGPEPASGEVTARSARALAGRGEDLPLTELYRPAAALRAEEVEAIAADLGRDRARPDRRRAPARSRAGRRRSPPSRRPPATRSWPSRPRRCASAHTTAAA